MEMIPKGTLGLCCLADLNSAAQLAVMLRATWHSAEGNEALQIT